MQLCPVKTQYLLQPSSRLQEFEHINLMDANESKKVSTGGISK